MGAVSRVAQCRGRIERVQRPPAGGDVESLKGKLLISGPGLFDDNFRHTVVLLGAHDGAGAVGVVLNRPLDVTLGEAVPTLAEVAGPDERLFQGGPLEPRQAVLLVDVADPSLLDVPVLGSVGFLTGEVSDAVRPAVRRARVYLGHAGWGAGQLEAELEAGAWIVEPATGDDIFTPDPDALWRRVLERKGPPYTTMARTPYDPRTN
jgi:putative transcriptional regulator